MSELAQRASAPEMEQMGNAFTVKVAAAEATLPHVLLNRARNCLALSVGLVAKV